MARAVKAGARELERWADELARAVEGKQSAGEIRAALDRAAEQLNLDRFAEITEQAIVHGAMLGALDSLEERESEEPEPLAAAARARTILAKRETTFAQKPFEQAIKLFQSRNIVPRDIFDTLTDAAKKRAFTVAGLATEELLGDAHAELTRQLRASPEHTYKDPDTGKWVYRGPNLREFRGFVSKRLESAGWTPANPSHVETIYRTNIASAYSSGRVAEMTQPAVLKARPYWQIRTVKDSRQRKTHRAADGVVLPVDHSFWRVAFPPFGYNCRCRVISRSQRWVDAHGGVSAPPTGLPDPGFTSGTQALLVPDVKALNAQQKPPAPPPQPPAPPKPAVEPPAPQWSAPPPPAPKVKAPKRPPARTSEEIMKTQLSGPKGSNPGGIYLGSDGKKRYVKLYKDPAQAVGEHVANQVYADLGLGRVKSQLFEHGGRTAYASEIIEGATTLGKTNVTPELARKALDGLVGDLVTANWDAVGLSLDNILVTKSGKLLRIDNGGTFLMRAQAGRKPAHLLNKLTEWDGFFDPKVNYAHSHLTDLAGVKGPADLLPTIEKKLKQLKALKQQSGGWLEYVQRAAPGASEADARAMAKMLETRTKLIGQKVKETKALIAEQKAAAKAAAAVKKAAEKAQKLKPKPPKAGPGALKSKEQPAPFTPWRADPATLKESVDQLPARDFRTLERVTRQPTDQIFLDKMRQTVDAIRAAPSVERAIRSYTGSNYGHIRLAERVKLGRQFPGDNERWREFAQEYKRDLLQRAEQLEEAQRRVAHLPRPHEGAKLYRGVRLRDDVVTDMLSRKALVFGGTGSTSFSARTASKFASLKSRSRESWSVVYEITGHKTGIAVDFLSSVKGESEVVFPAAARFRILGVEKIEGFDRAILVRVEEM